MGTQLPPPPPTTAEPHISGLAIASFVLGLLWLGFVGSILAVVFGALAYERIRKGYESGKGLAIAGIIMGAVPLVGLSVWLFG